MKHIRNLWSILKQEISLWKNEKKDLITGILYIGMITWLFYNRIVCMIFLSPFLFLWMRRQRTRREYKKKEILRKEFREMMLSIGNSLSAGYSIENSLKTAKNDLLMYQENSMLAKELHLLRDTLSVPSAKYSAKCCRCSLQELCMPKIKMSAESYLLRLRQEAAGIIEEASE